MTIQAEIADARRALERAGIDAVEAAVDADLLARTVLGWDRARLLASLAGPAPPRFHAAYAALVARRERREPAAYVAGFREFWGRDFEVGPGVLVPRPETELIVEEAAARLAGHLAAPGRRRTDPAVLVADVGTGSGCLAISLALELPHARVVATDISRAALDTATRNAARHDVLDRIQFVHANVLAGIDAAFDLIVSNPPYVPAADMNLLPPEVRDYEPREALFGGEAGLDLITELLLQAESRMKADAVLAFEFGFGQEAAVRGAVAARPAFTLETIRRDLQGIPRTAIVRWSPPR